MLEASWYPVALSGDIAPGTGNGTRIHGREIVVWRGVDGVAHVWDDRCPHRGMRLSFGFIRGNDIACLYHGWRYDGAGRCRYVPAHPQLTPPETIKASVHASVERLGMVWMRGDGDDPPPEERTVTPVRSITIACPPRDVAQSLRRDPGTGSRFGPFLVANGAGDEETLIGLQPLSDKASVLHMVIAGMQSDNAQKRASRWSEDLRCELETAAACRVGHLA